MSAPHLHADDCLEEDALEFVAFIGAPGRGHAYECSVCSHPFVKVGGTFYDAREQVFELDPEDVR